MAAKKKITVVPNDADTAEKLRQAEIAAEAERADTLQSELVEATSLIAEARSMLMVFAPFEVMDLKQRLTRYLEKRGWL